MNKTIKNPFYKGCGRTTGHGESCIDGWICSSCQKGYDHVESHRLKEKIARDTIKRLETELKNERGWIMGTMNKTMTKYFALCETLRQYSHLCLNESAGGFDTVFIVVGGKYPTIFFDTIVVTRYKVEFNLQFNFDNIESEYEKHEVIAREEFPEAFDSQFMAKAWERREMIAKKEKELRELKAGNCE